jgi:hypothetical protein
VVSPFVTTPYGASSQEALQHVLDHVFCLPSNGGIHLSIMAEGFVRIGQVIGMSTATMAALSVYQAKVAGIVSSICLLAYLPTCLLAYLPTT